MSDTQTTALITTADRSTKTLLGTIGQLGKVVAEVQALGSVVENLTADIQQRESQLANVEAQITHKQREAAANLNLAVLENERSVLGDLLAKFGLAEITKGELSQLKVSLEGAIAGNEAATEAAVKSAGAALHSQYSSEIARLKNAQSVETATLNANAAAAQERIAFLLQELQAAREQIVQERNARVQIAEAEAKRQAVTVNAGKQ